MPIIWCVDDDNTIRDIEVYTLTQTGFEAKGFPDGLSMLEALKTEKPELIVLDIMMPGMDGVEVLKETGGTGLGLSIVSMLLLITEEKSNRKVQLM